MKFWGGQIVKKYKTIIEKYYFLSKEKHFLPNSNIQQTFLDIWLIESNFFTTLYFLGNFE